MWCLANLIKKGEQLFISHDPPRLDAAKERMKYLDEFNMELKFMIPTKYSVLNTPSAIDIQFNPAFRYKTKIRSQEKQTVDRRLCGS